MRVVHALLLLLVLAVPAVAQDIFQEGTKITVKLQNGDTISGLLESADTNNLVILHDIFGRITVPRAAIVTEPPKPEVPPVEPWSGSFDLSLSGSEGNTDTQIFRTQLDLRHEDEEAVDTFTIWYRRATTDDTATEEKGFTQLRHEWKMEGSKWRTFVQGSYETDQFTAYNARASVAGGAAYAFNEGPEHKTTGRLGAGMSRKFGNDDPDVEDTTYEALLGFDWYWTISALSSFSFNLDFYPGINPGGEFRSVTKLAYNTKMDDDSAWFLKLGLDQFHDSDPGAGASQNDTNYYVGMGRTF